MVIFFLLILASIFFKFSQRWCNTLSALLAIRRVRKELLRGALFFVYSHKFTHGIVVLMHGTFLVVLKELLIMPVITFSKLSEGSIFLCIAFKGDPIGVPQTVSS
jgi:hypothetical protein